MYVYDVCNVCMCEGRGVLTACVELEININCRARCSV